MTGQPLLEGVYPTYAECLAESRRAEAARRRARRRTEAERVLRQHGPLWMITFADAAWHAAHPCTGGAVEGRRDGRRPWTTAEVEQEGYEARLRRGGGVWEGAYGEALEAMLTTMRRYHRPRRLPGVAALAAAAGGRVHLVRHALHAASPTVCGLGPHAACAWPDTVTCEHGEATCPACTRTGAQAAAAEEGD